MASAESLALLHQATPFLEAAALGMARPAGAAIVLPAFTRAELGGPVRAALAFVLSIPVIPALGEALQQHDASHAPLVLLAAKEVFLGLIIGVLYGVPIWSIQCAGELLDTQRSATQDRQSEQSTGNQDSTAATFLGITAVTMFALMGGFGLLAQTIDRSYEIWPVLHLAPLPEHGATIVVLGLLDHVTRVSLAMASPIVLAMLLGEACVILLMRAVPKLKLYDLAPTLRNIVFALVMFAYVDYLLAFMHNEIGSSVSRATATLGALLR